MCGIIGILARRPTDAALELDDVLAELGRLAALPAGTIEEVLTVADGLEALDAGLRGPLGSATLLSREDGPGAVRAATDAFAAPIAAFEASLEDAGDLETANLALLRLKDAAWAIGRERVATARGVADLLGSGPDLPLSALCAYWAIDVSLAGIDRLEVRGRDSAGLNVLVRGVEVDDDALARREEDPLYRSLAVGRFDDAVSFAYKVAAEIGELGDNTAALREQIRGDDVLRAAVMDRDAEVTVLGHTRWASVGVISEANAHPLRSGSTFAAVNGDVDNYRELESAELVVFPPEITTDAKVVAALVDRARPEGDLDTAFAGTVGRCEGSAAIALSTADDPDRLHLALRGSGQALYVGLARDAFLIASEPYGVVQETADYVPMASEGRTGEVVVLDRAGAGTLEGLQRLAYDGSARPVDAASVRRAEIGPRDIDRGDHPHFLLKEISEAPSSFGKTLRGKIAETRDGLAVRLASDTLPRSVIDRLPRINRVLVVAQGTAAVAGQSVANAIGTALLDAPVAVAPMLATELSGFNLADDMSDTLVIAVSQSGTTTDTNRTVDLVRARGAAVLAIVNRRNSDLVGKADGVLYTSDGRDVEMSVASTKAFYAQVAAGWLFALALADELGVGDKRFADRLLRGLRDLPSVLSEVLGLRDAIGAAARAEAPRRRHWAIVGNGPNRVAAEEVRIKLSELCYHAIACDGTEDKKHIDLSSEPMIFVCAAGLAGPTADDVGKEVAIFRAHQAAPIVVCTAGEGERFASALHTIEVPATEPELGFVLSAMVGHLFGYEAALAIDELALPLREARSVLEQAIAAGRWELDPLRDELRDAGRRFFAILGERRYDGNLEASTAVRVSGLVRYATGQLPVEGYELDFGKVGTPDAIVTDLAAAVSDAVSELTRPVDAIKHQAKTVTVGISRSEEELLGAPLVRAALDAGAPATALSYRAMRALAALGPFVADIAGFTRYAIEGDVDGGTARIGVVARGGIAEGLTSRTDTDDRLLGAKHRAATEREVTVAVGARDGRTLVLVPEVAEGVVTGLTLLHVAPVAALALDELRDVMTGYRGRYMALSDAVTETEATFDDARMADIAPVELLTAPVFVLARHWKR